MSITLGSCQPSCISFILGYHLQWIYTDLIELEKLSNGRFTSEPYSEIIDDIYQRIVTTLLSGSDSWVPSHRKIFSNSGGIRLQMN